MSNNLPIIALLGNAHSGKDTAGSYIVEASGGMRMAFADKLKTICAEMFGLSHEDLYTEEGKNRLTDFDCLRCPKCQSMSVEVVKLEDSRPPYPLGCDACSAVGEAKVFKSKWTPRMIAQYIGTEGFRRVSPNVWIDYLLKNARRVLTSKPLVVVTDTRFRSECEGIWRVGGEVWRIKRPEAQGNVGIAGHASETEQNSISDNECQAVIMNDDSLDTFRGRVLAQLARFTERRSA